MVEIFLNPHQSICLLSLEIEEGGERERNIDLLPPLCTSTGDGNHNLVMCPDQQPQPFGVQDDAPSN